MYNIDEKKTIQLFEKLYFFNSISKENEYLCQKLVEQTNLQNDNSIITQMKLLCIAMYYHENSKYELSYEFAKKAFENILPTKKFFGKKLHIQTNLIYTRCYSFVNYDCLGILKILENSLDLSSANNNFAKKDILTGIIDINIELQDYETVHTILQSLYSENGFVSSTDLKYSYYYGMARLNSSNNDNMEGIKYYKLCLPMCDRKEEIYCHIASEYRQIKKYKDAITFAHKSIKESIVNNNNELQLVAETELLLNKSSIKLFNKSFWVLFKKVLLSLNNTEVISLSIFEILHKITIYHIEISDYNNALKYCNQGISLITQSGLYKKTLLNFKKKLLKIKIMMNKSTSEIASDFDQLMDDIEENNNMIINKYKNKHHIEFQTKHKELEIKHLKELDEYKKRFYTNITHDIRTPISLILAPLESSISQTTEIDQKRNLQIAYQNAKKLEYFLDQLLDLNKMEEGLLKPKYVYGNIKEFCLHIVETFQQQRKIAFTSTISHIQKRCYFDADAIGKILYNLVSNAIKFSAPSSMVCVNIGYKNNNVILSIKDNGIGISEDQLEKIFDRFYQIDNADTKPYQGSGIGLSIVKDYTNLLGGKISVESKLGVGTTFTIILPYKNKIDSNDLLSSDNITSDLPMPNFPLSSSSVSEKSAKIENDNRDTILLVDDNEELRNFLSSQLAKTYNIIEAENGAEGWQKAQKYIPTLVITDIMMPIMDGISMCEKIKANKNTNHIPVILLSAKTSLQAETTGYFAMADAYIKKPFSIEILFATIRSIIHNRNIMRSQVIEAIRNNLLTKLNIQTNDIFIKQFHSFIENNIYNPSLNVDLIARELNISRITLLRKVKHYTGKKTKEIITETRLNTAKILLEKKDSTVKNIAYSLGFVNIDHFYKLYKKQFGVTPANKNK